MANWEFHFRNFDNTTRWFGAYHAGCGMAPWHTGRPRCWSCAPNNNPTGGQSSVYVPSDWVVNFGAWFNVILAGLEEAVNIGIAIASEGEDEDAIVDAIKGAFNVGEDVVKAEIEQHKLNTEDLGKLLYENFNKACSAIGQEPATVRQYAADMGLGDRWGLIAGSEYQEKVYGDNSINGGYGWTMLYAQNDDTTTSVSQIANHAFIQNGHFIYMWDENNHHGFWNSF